VLKDPNAYGFLKNLVFKVKKNVLNLYFSFDLFFITHSYKEFAFGRQNLSNLHKAANSWSSMSFYL